MVVLNPLKVVITNLEANSEIEVDAKKWPDAQADDASAFYKIPFSSVVYIEHSDFRMQDSKDYYGLAPGKSVILRYAFPIKCTEVILAEDIETILEIRAEYDPSKKNKPKGVLHWVAEPSPGVDPLRVEVRLFERLFVSENPAELDNWLGDINPNSKVIIPNAYCVSSLQNAKVGDNFQFERLGYFVVDRDTTSEKLVFNRTVTLKDSYSKGGKRWSSVLLNVLHVMFGWRQSRNLKARGVYCVRIKDPEEGGFPSYLFNRLRRRMPAVKIC
ncbi:hypothetical protein VNO78_09934 [Psophocarpus tetragonolobus]|uniref:glutamine--tRNA ligase n=1 Tax=Psophocarpus tetragonolobus TaxID=3891 RepID=A0AAN9SKC0_PSOTE